MKPEKPKRERKQRRRPAVTPDDNSDFETPDNSIPKPHELPVTPPTVLRLR